MLVLIYKGYVMSLINFFDTFFQWSEIFPIKEKANKNQVH